MRQFEQELNFLFYHLLLYIKILGVTKRTIAGYRRLMANGNLEIKK